MEKFDKYKNKGLTGLCNLGNSCYLNTCMQILSHTYELKDILSNDDILKSLNNNLDSTLLIEWKQLNDLMWKQNCTISPNRFINCVRKTASEKSLEIFASYEQNDFQEFLLFIIECFHNSLKRNVDMMIIGETKNEIDKLARTCYNMIKKMFKNEYSKIIELFYGIHLYQIKDIEDNILKNIPEPFHILSLSIPDNIKQNVNIYNCIDFYCKEELLDGDNKWYNEKTKEKQIVKKNLVFWSLPNILIIDLKRWNSNLLKNKINIMSEICNLDLRKYVIGYNKDSYIYDLYAVSNHSGGVNGGHYYCNIKNANNKWYNFNDTFISEISINNIITNHTYCLFYRKK